MPSMPMRRRAPSSDQLDRGRSELQRAMAVVDDVARTGNLARLGQAFAGDALSEVRSRFHAYQMAGIQVSPFRESLHVELAPARPGGGLQMRVRYRDRTSFLCSGDQPVTANDPVQLSLVMDTTLDPWKVVFIAEE
ncbi:MAG: hypothetical protein ACYCX9_02805 [Candidatus Dormibacteria bacterium]